MKKATMEISGMYCASCAGNIERSLSKVKGVSNIRVNVIAKKGFADVDDSVLDDDIKKAVKKAGYEVKSLELK